MVDKVEETPFIPQELDSLTRELHRLLNQYGFRLNSVLPKDGSEKMSNPLLLFETTVAGRPTASSWKGGIIFVSDAAAGSKFQGSDGTSWVSLG